MSRPPLPARSDSTRTAGPPSDAAEPDDKAVIDVYRSVEETGSLEMAAKKLQKYAAQQRAWEDDPEEAGFLAQQDESMEENGMKEEEEVVHMQEVLPGLWIGDLVAAMDAPSLKANGITNILSLLRPRLSFAPDFAVYPLEIDDAADTDILTHLPSCVAWINEALAKRQMAEAGEKAMSPLPPRDKTIAKGAGETNAGGVLVHCQAGMSRSATVVVAYLMKTLDLGPVEALQMLLEKRPVVDPSDTFWFQLGLFYNADGRVSLKDRSTRQFYMERTATHFMNGEGGAPPMDKMAKYPATPSESQPPTPMGGHGRRKIRCKMCRRHLAVREHMMDHILEQSPISRPHTPSNFSLPSPRLSMSSMSGVPNSERERRASVVSDVINPLTGMPGRHSRHASISSSGPSPVNGSFPAFTSIDQSTPELSPITPGGVPQPRKGSAPGLAALSQENQATPKVISDILPGKERSSSPSAIKNDFGIKRKESTESFHSAPAGPTSSRPLRSAADINSSLPPHLLALRNHGQSISALSSPFNASPSSSPERETIPQMPHHAFPPSNTSPSASGLQRSRSQSSGSNSGGGIGRRMSLLAMTPAGGPRERRGSATNEGVIATSGPPILVNPKCSGYFVEPLTWMEPFLKNGEISGKIVCPNEKCGVKIGNFDWAGVQCGCKEWVTPGFCISRSKVDEVW